MNKIPFEVGAKRTKQESKVGQVGYRNFCAVHIVAGDRASISEEFETSVIPILEGWLVPRLRRPEQGGRVEAETELNRLGQILNGIFFATGGVDESKAQHAAAHPVAGSSSNSALIKRQ